MTKIILVRHGQSEANVAHLFAGQSEASLTALGHAQAAAVADYLTAHEKITAVYASEFSRATDTVRPTAERLGLTVIPEPGLREIFAGVWENRPFDFIKSTYAADYEAWKNDIPNARPTYGERVADLYERVNTTVVRLARAHEGQTILLGSHWTPVLAVISRAICGSIAGMVPENTPLNAAIHIFRYENDILTPERLNVTEHLSALPQAPAYKA
jgi:broad specificity phosphatase PhoE